MKKFFLTITLALVAVLASAQVRVKAVLEKQGFSVFREYYGSEDGEAVTYRDATGQYRFLMHMDPGFVDDLPEDDVELEAYIRENENI